MELRGNCVVLTVFLLFVVFAVQADDEKHIKTNYIEEFGPTFKKFHIELMLANLDSSAKLGNTLVESKTLDENVKEKFEKHLKTIEELRKRLNESLTQDTLKAVKAYTSRSGLDLLLLRLNPTVVSDKNKLKTVQGAMDESVKIETAALNSFAQNVAEKWREVYKNIPKEELEQNKKLAEINTAIEDASKVNIKKLVDTGAVVDMVVAVTSSLKDPAYNGFLD